MFLDSETAIGLIRPRPGPIREAVVPPKEMIAHPRDEINRVTQSAPHARHGLITASSAREISTSWTSRRHPQGRRVKGYTGAAPKGFDRGWFVDDEKIAYPCSSGRQARVRASACTKGLPSDPWPDYNHRAIS